jgi:hypothetical protein
MQHASHVGRGNGRQHEIRMRHGTRKVARNLYMTGQQKTGQVPPILTELLDFGGPFRIASP